MHIVCKWLEFFFLTQSCLLFCFFYFNAALSGNKYGASPVCCHSEFTLSFLQDETLQQHPQKIHPCRDKDYVVVQDVAHSIQSVTNNITHTRGKYSHSVWDQPYGLTLTLIFSRFSAIGQVWKCVKVNLFLQFFSYFLLYDKSTRNMQIHARVAAS